MSGIGKSLRLLYFSKIRTKATHPLCFDEFSLFTNNWTYEGEVDLRFYFRVQLHVFSSKIFLAVPYQVFYWWENVKIH